MTRAHLATGLPLGRVKTSYEEQRLSNVHRIKDKSAIDDEAAEWVWRLDDEDVQPEAKAAFQRWLDADPRHRKAVEDFKEIWGRLDELAVLKHDSKIRTVRRGVNEDELQRAFPVPLRTVRYGAIAASLCIVALATFLFMGPRIASPDTANYATAVGQQRVVELADGSIVELNTNTIVEVDYSGAERLVRLQKGEAHFVVAKNPDRPFIVKAGDTAVRAVGTAFNVYIAPEGVTGAPVEVIVTEGKVEVTKASEAVPAQSVAIAETGGSLPSPVFLEAGESLRAQAPVREQWGPQLVAAVTETDLERELAWRNGMLIFEGEPLEKAVEELSRYTEARFVIVDDAIRDRRVGGYFRTGDVDSLLSVLEEGLFITVQRQGDMVILLSDAKRDVGAGASDG